MKFQPFTLPWLTLAAWLLGTACLHAAPVSELQVRIVTGERELIAGSSLELRIYEAGKKPRPIQLVHGETWPRDSTHVVPVKLAEALDPRSVVRFSLTYRSPIAAATELDIVSADIEMPAEAGGTQRLLGVTLSGVIARQGELATEERDPAAIQCKSDADCDDQRSCNGVERCAPRSPGADARGCVKGTPLVCPVNQVCGEGVGCRGISASPKP